METTTDHSGSIFHSNRVKGTLVLVLLLLSVFLFAETIKSFKEYRFVGSSVPASNVISVSGEGEVFAIPDIAVFTFSVNEEAETADTAQEMATEKITSALAFVREQGVEDDDIKTINYNLSPRYEYAQATRDCTRYPCPPANRELVGFSVNQTVQVKLRDTDKAGDFVVGLAGLAVQNVNGPDFSIDDDDVLQEEARKAAIDDARAKAEKLAGDLGVTLVRIVSFSENGSYPPVMMRASMDMAEEAMGGAMPAPAPDLPTGENRIVSNVTVSYEIR